MLGKVPTVCVTGDPLATVMLAVLGVKLLAEMMVS